MAQSTEGKEKKSRKTIHQNPALVYYNEEITKRFDSKELAEKYLEEEGVMAAGMELEIFLLYGSYKMEQTITNKLTKK